MVIGVLISICFQQVWADTPLLPSHRIVGYYGNFASPRMGVLGEYPPEQMLDMLNKELKKWAAADPKTPVIPAIEYIAVVAQNHPVQMANTEPGCPMLKSKRLLLWPLKLMVWSFWIYKLGLVMCKQKS